MIDAVRDRFNNGPMSRTQVTAIAITVILSALDGYDVLSVTFAAPAITAAWGIGKAALGVVLSAGLAGMAIGSLALAPFADVIGRRWLLLISLALMSLGSLLCAFAGSLPELAAWRVVTGLGIGACVAVINPLSAEFANLRRRPLTVSMMAMGYPVGGVVGGLLAALLLRLYGWPAVFIGGFIAGVGLIPLVAWLLPESPAFLLTRSRPDSLARLNAVLVRCGHAPVETLPPAVNGQSRGYAAIFAVGQRGVTIRLMIANLLYASAVYYVLSWLPQMVADAGFAPSSASLVAALASSAGVVGGLTLGWLAQRMNLKRLTVASVIAFGLSTTAFGLTPPLLPLLFLASGILGFFLFAGVAGLYATLATAFAVEARASGAGFVIGIGRIASAIGPLLAGWLFASGLERGAVSAAFGACAVAAGLILALGGRHKEAE